MFLRVSICLIMAACVTGCGSSPESPRKRPAEIHFIIDSTKLASAFEVREPEAVELFGGKHGRITGIFAKAEPLADGHIAMTFKTSIATFRPVRCIFDGTASTALNKFAAGDEITVTGKIVGFAESRYFVTVEECLIDREGN